MGRDHAVGLLYGALFGVVFGLVAFALTGGRRDFTSRSQIVATTYDVVCTWGKLEEAQGSARPDAPHLWLILTATCATR